MRIVTVPHPVLRQQAQPVSQVDKKLEQLIEGLTSTLITRKNPRGVGLAAPQVDVSKRVFATWLAETDAENDQANPMLRVFMNPEIVAHTEEVTLGPDKKHPTLEGCFSIPGLYGPVPRWTSITLSFQELSDGELLHRTEDFSDFAGRVVQHELDHLNGVLFIDYSLKYDLPVYQENKDTNRLEEIDPKVLEGL